MRNNKPVVRKNVRNSKQALVESIMTRVSKEVKKALNEAVYCEPSEFDEFAINSPEDGINRYVVILDGGYTGYYIYADFSEDAIDFAFDYAAENDPESLNDKDAEELMRREIRLGTPEDEIYEILDDTFYSGGNEGVHYTYYDNFSIQEWED